MRRRIATGWLQKDLLGILGEVNPFDRISPLMAPDTSISRGDFGYQTALDLPLGAFDPQLGRKGHINIGGEEIDFYQRILTAEQALWWTPEAIIQHHIPAAKLSRRQLLDLHYRLSWVEGSRDRDQGWRLPPARLWL